MTDYNTKSDNIGSHFEFQDGQRILNNIRLNHVYYNEGLKPTSNYLLILNVKIWQKIIFLRVSMTAILNSELTNNHSYLLGSSLVSSSSKQILSISILEAEL